MINFIQRFDDIAYKNIIDTYINSIIKHLNPKDYQITGKVLDNCLNVSFCTEVLPHNGVFLNHGLADKNYASYNSVKDYDLIFVSGELKKEKYIKQGINPNKIFIGGYTKLDPLFNGEYKKNKYNKPVLLYAPSHTNSPSLQGKFEQYFDVLSKKYHIINSVHPYNKENKKPTMQYLYDADVVISDCSSIIYEALSLNKPVIFADWLVKDIILKTFENTFESYIYNNMIGYHARNINEFMDFVEFALELGVDDKTKKFIDSIFLKELRGTSGKITAEKLLELAKCKNMS